MGQHHALHALPKCATSFMHVEAAIYGTNGSVGCSHAHLVWSRATLKHQIYFYEGHSSLPSDGVGREDHGKCGYLAMGVVAAKFQTNATSYEKPSISATFNFNRVIRAVTLQMLSNDGHIKIL
jgi:hypothetical protein